MKKRIHHFFTLLVAVLFSANSVYAAPIAIEQQQDQRPAVAALEQPAATSKALVQNDPATTFENQGAVQNLGGVLSVGQSFLVQPTQPHSFPVYPEDSVLDAKCNVSGNKCHTHSDGRFVLEIYQRGKLSVSYTYQRQDGTNLLNEATEYSRNGKKIKTTSYRLDAPIVNGQQIVKLIPSAVTFFDTRDRPTHKDFLSSNGSIEKTETYRKDGRINEIVYFNPETKQRTKREEYTYELRTNRLKEILIYTGSSTSVLTSKKTFSYDASSNLAGEQIFNRVKVGRRFEWQLAPVSIQNVAVKEIVSEGVLLSFEVAGLPAGQAYELDYRKVGDTNWIMQRVGGGTDYQTVLSIPNDGAQYEYRLRVIDSVVVKAGVGPVKVPVATLTGNFTAVARAKIANVQPVTTTSDGAEIIWDVEHLLPTQSTELVYRKIGDASWTTAELCNFGNNIICSDSISLNGAGAGNQTRGAKLSGLVSNTDYEFEIRVVQGAQVLQFQQGGFKTKTLLYFSENSYNKTINMDVIQGNPNGTFRGPDLRAIFDPSIISWHVVANQDWTYKSPDGTVRQIDPRLGYLTFVAPSTTQGSIEPQVLFSSVITGGDNKTPEGIFRGTMKVYASVLSSGVSFEVMDLPFEVEVKRINDDPNLFFDYPNENNFSFERTAVAGMQYAPVGTISVTPKTDQVQYIYASPAGNDITFTGLDGVTVPVASNTGLRFFYDNTNHQIKVSGAVNAQPGVYQGTILLQFELKNGYDMSLKVPVNVVVTGEPSPEFQFASQNFEFNVQTTGYISTGVTSFAIPVSGVQVRDTSKLIHVALDGTVSKFNDPFHLTGFIGITGGVSYGSTTSLFYQVAQSAPAGHYFGVASVEWKSSGFKNYKTSTLDYRFNVTRVDQPAPAGALPAFKMQAEEIVIPAGQTLEVNGVLDIPAGGTLKLGTVEIHGPFHVEGRIKITKDAINIDPNAQVTMDGGSISVGGNVGAGANGNVEIAGQGSNIQVVGGNNDMILMDAEIIEEKK